MIIVLTPQHTATHCNTLPQFVARSLVGYTRSQRMTHACMHSVLQCGAVCCSVLQCVARGFQGIAVCHAHLFGRGSINKSHAFWCTKCVAVRCSAVQGVAVRCRHTVVYAVYCSVIVISFSVLQCVALTCWARA